jgi:chitinase
MEAAHQANLFPSNSTPTSTTFHAVQGVNYSEDNGLPVSELILGMPLNGRLFYQPLTQWP